MPVGTREPTPPHGTKPLGNSDAMRWEGTRGVAAEAGVVGRKALSDGLFCPVRLGRGIRDHARRRRFCLGGGHPVVNFSIIAVKIRAVSAVEQGAPHREQGRNDFSKWRIPPWGQPLVATRRQQCRFSLHSSPPQVLENFELLPSQRSRGGVSVGRNEKCRQSLKRVLSIYLQIPARIHRESTDLV
jgi:hypothetical protein